MELERKVSLYRLSSIRVLLTWLWKTWKDYRWQAIFNTLIGCFLVVLDLSFVWMTKLTVDIATHVERVWRIEWAVICLICIIVLQIALGIVSKWIRAVLGVKAQNKMQRQLFERLLDSQWKGLKRFHTGDLLNRMERDVSDIVNFLTESLPSLISTLAQFIGAFLFLFWMDHELALIVLLVIPLFLLISRLYIRRMRNLTHEVRASESNIQSVLQESLQHSLVLKTLERVGFMVNRLSFAQSTLQRQVIRRTKYSTFSSGLMNIGFASGYLITFVWGVISLEAGTITYGALLAFIQLVGQIQGPVRRLTQFVPVFISSFTASERLMELENVPLETDSASHRCKGKVGLRLSDVTFRYTDKSRKILDSFSFDFPPGSITAIVGETGAGKTTLIRLLLSLIRPQTGNVQLYDEQGNVYAASAGTRCNFSYVPQGNTLLSGTIRENLLLGNPMATEEEMNRALAMAAADFVFSLPDRLDTLCGEMGDGLSEGQAQRISIARALLKDNAILLFDEATSSLDSDTERSVLSNIMEARLGRTLIFITHRPEVLRYCTQQLCLKKQ